ncbi:MAG: efflux RND transporter periplasmic adaptor subunit [Kiloniellales bacterium]
MRKRSLFIVGLAVLGLAAAGATYFDGRGDAAPAAYRTAKVERGALVSAISSGGTLSAVVTVQVGSQISGQVKELLADFNSEVRAGQVIARIDPENFAARVRQAKAEQSVAESNVMMQEAAIDRAKAELANTRAGLAAARAQSLDAKIALDDAKLDLERTQELHRRGVIATSQVEKAQAAYDRAEAKLQGANSQIRAQESLVGARQAAVRMAEAQLLTALAQVEHRKAVLHNSEVDLEHTVIRSPVDGVVIQRSVDIGQTVAASLQAPVLFTIAQDLRRMQVEVNVDEADIGQIQVNQRATFTVDAFPGRDFNGNVIQIRKLPKVQQNVVTYTVIVSADNTQQALLPGMTANVRVLVAERPQALKIANAGLRYRPAGASGVSATAAAPQAARRAGGGGRGRGRQNVEQLTEALGLSEEQKAQLRPFFADLRRRFAGGHGGGHGGGDGAAGARGGDGDAADLRAQRQHFQTQFREAVIAVLTPEQREKYQALQSERDAVVRRARVWVLDENGAPKPVDVGIGISDGSFTEIVSGELEEGQLIITGVNEAAESRTRRFTGFRL